MLIAVVGLAVAVAIGQRRLPAPAAGHVDVVGDSLVHQASAPLDAALERAGYEATIVGLPSHSLSSAGIRARLDELARQAGDVLVVATTTNDVNANLVSDGLRSTAPTYRQDVSALLDRFADRCVVVVNARDRMNPLYQPERAAVLNAELALLEHQHANLVLVDWAARSRDLPAEWFSDDQLHFGGRAESETPDSASARLYAQAIVEGVQRCGRRAPEGAR